MTYSERAYARSLISLANEYFLNATRPNFIATVCPNKLNIFELQRLLENVILTDEDFTEPNGPLYVLLTSDSAYEITTAYDELMSRKVSDSFLAYVLTSCDVDFIRQHPKDALERLKERFHD